MLWLPIEHTFSIQTLFICNARTDDDAVGPHVKETILANRKQLVRWIWLHGPAAAAGVAAVRLNASCYTQSLVGCKWAGHLQWNTRACLIEIGISVGYFPLASSLVCRCGVGLVGWLVAVCIYLVPREAGKMCLFRETAKVDVVPTVEW